MISKQVINVPFEPILISCDQNCVAVANNKQLMVEDHLVKLANILHLAVIPFQKSSLIVVGTSSGASLYRLIQKRLAEPSSISHLSKDPVELIRFCKLNEAVALLLLVQNGTLFAFELTFDRCTFISKYSLPGKLGKLTAMACSKSSMVFCGFHCHTGDLEYNYVVCYKIDHYGFHQIYCEQVDEGLEVFCINDILPRGKSSHCDLLYPNQFKLLKVDRSINSTLEVPNYQDWFTRYPHQISYKKLKLKCSHIKQRMNDDQLFFDYLIRLANETLPEAYPPKDVTQLEYLYNQIWKSDKIDLLRKQCLTLYLLFDLSFDQVRIDSKDETASERFIMRYGIPKHYSYLIRGFWQLDHGILSIDPFLQPIVLEMVDQSMSLKIVQLLYQCQEWESLIKFLKVLGITTKWEADAHVPNYRQQLAVLMMISYIRTNNLYEAVCLQTSADSDLDLMLLYLLLKESFENQNEALIRLLTNLPLNQKQENILVTFINNLNDSSANVALILYYVYRSRHLDALNLYDQMKSEADEWLKNLMDNLKLVVSESVRSLGTVRTAKNEGKPLSASTLLREAMNAGQPITEDLVLQEMRILYPKKVHQSLDYIVDQLKFLERKEVLSENEMEIEEIPEELSRESSPPKQAESAPKSPPKNLVESTKEKSVIDESNMNSTSEPMQTSPVLLSESALEISIQQEGSFLDFSLTLPVQSDSTPQKVAQNSTPTKADPTKKLTKIGSTPIPVQEMPQLKNLSPFSPRKRIGATIGSALGNEREPAMGTKSVSRRLRSPPKLGTIEVLDSPAKLAQNDGAPRSTRSRKALQIKSASPEMTPSKSPSLRKSKRVTKTPSKPKRAIPTDDSDTGKRTRTISKELDLDEIANVNTEALKMIKKEPILRMNLRKTPSRIQRSETPDSPIIQKLSEAVEKTPQRRSSRLSKKV